MLTNFNPVLLTHRHWRTCQIPFVLMLEAHVVISCRVAHVQTLRLLSVALLSVAETPGPIGYDPVATILWAQVSSHPLICLLP